MVDQLTEGFPIHVNVKLLLQVSLVTVELLGRELGIPFTKFVQNFDNNRLRFAFPLDIR